jgi:hypothetical protein
MTETASAPTETTESVEEFAARARAWLAENMPSIDPNNPPEHDRGEEAPWLRARELQTKLYEGGFAGICFPKEYGGLGLPIAYQKAFDNESRCYELPIILNTPTFTICAATILDAGSEEQKHQHISAVLRRRGTRPAAIGAQRRIGSGGCHHPGRSKGRQVGYQRREDVEHQRILRQLRTDAGPHRLGSAQARGTDDVPGADRQSRNHVAAHQAGQRIGRVL